MKLDQWSRYWQAGQLTSLPQDFAANYEGEIRDCWVSYFSELPNQSSVLDLCTGNGAVALLAQSYSHQHSKQLSVTGLDGASISLAAIHSRYPDWSQQIDAVNFIDNQAIETMALGEQYDLITSQYGIEYCDWSVVAPKVSEHLKPGGNFVIITHAPETDITQYMKQERSDYDAIKEAKFFRAIDNILTEQINFTAFKKQMVSLQKHLARMLQNKPSPLVQGIYNFTQHMIASDYDTFTHQRSNLESFYLDHLFAYERLNDILTVSERLSENKEWYKPFCDAGLDIISVKPILQGGRHLAGIGYHFTKP